jgi:hypothetical protein
MADFDFNNIFGNNTDTSNILFDENQLSIIRDQFQKEIVTPLFQKYKNLYDKIEDKISENSNNKSFIDKSSDPIGIKDYKKSKNINKKLDDIANPFLVKLENYYSELSKNLDNPSIFNFLPNINFTNLNDKIQKKVSDIENKLNINIDENSLEETPKKTKSSKLKSRSAPVDFDINRDINEKIEPVKSKELFKSLEPVKDKNLTEKIEPVKDKNLTEKIEPVKDKNLTEKIEPVKDEIFTVKDFSDEFTDNIIVLIEETVINRTLLEKINDSIFNVKSFTSTYFSMFDKILSDALPNLNENNIGATSTGLEQKKIGDSIPEISLSEKTITQFKTIFSDLFVSDMFKGLFSSFNIDDLKEKLNPFSEQNKSSWLDSLLGGISTLLLGAGAIMLFMGPVWDEFIKPWLEEKLGVKLYNFDEILGKFEQSFDGISKWLITSGLYLKGVIFESLGKAFTLLGNVIENFDILVKKSFTYLDDVIKGAKAGAGAVGEAAKFGSGAIKAGADVAKAGAVTGGEAVGKGALELTEIAVEKESGTIIGKGAAFLPKVAGKIFGGVGKTILKAIPFVGSALSLYFAYDDFEKGDYTSMSLNLGSALIGLIPGFGTAISFGLDIFNAMLDWNTTGSTQEERNTNKTALFADWGNKLTGLIKKVPFFETFVHLGEALDALINGGDYGTAFQKLDRIPGLGLVTGFMKSLFDSTNVKTQDGSVKTFDTGAFQKRMKRLFAKQFLSLVPSAFGFREKVAGWLGLTDDLESNDKFDESQIL